jgi:hypothetical protein
MNMEGVLLLLLQKWLESGPVLGVAAVEWALFSPKHQVILCALLMQRRNVLDQCGLFHTAARLLVDPGIDMSVELFMPEPVRLGRPLAQPNRTLFLGGGIGLHAPSIELRIPMDRTQDPAAEPAERRLQILARLFKPVHIPLKFIWRVNRPVLASPIEASSIYLTHPSRPDADGAPASRLVKGI